MYGHLRAITCLTSPSDLVCLTSLSFIHYVLVLTTLLERNFADLKEALYDEDSKATSQIAVDIMLVQCLKHIRQKYQSAKTAQNVAQDGPSTPLKAAVTTEPITLFPEASMSVNMPNPLMANGRVVITGRTDWVLGYDNIGDDVTQLIALEVKQRSEFSIGEAQLIAYLAILRENRIRARKLNAVTQGFYSDGKRFAFVRITSDGIIQMSKNFNIVRETNLRAVFHFIVDIMETAMKSTPNATPTKPGQLQEKEINQSKDDVWSKALALIEESIVVGSDDDMEDAIDLQRT